MAADKNSYYDFRYGDFLSSIFQCPLTTKQTQQCFIKNTLYRCNNIGMRKTRNLLRNKHIKWFKSLRITGPRMAGVNHNKLMFFIGQNTTGIKKLFVSGPSVSCSSGNKLPENFFGKLSTVSLNSSNACITILNTRISFGIYNSNIILVFPTKNKAEKTFVLLLGIQKDQYFCIIESKTIIAKRWTFHF